jgi:YVTN family beta-propeller protein
MKLRPRHCLCAALLLLGGVFASAGKSQYLETVIGVGANPMDVLWNPASNKVYTANSQSGSVTVISGASNQVRATVGVADYPTFLCWNSISNKVYVTCDDPDWLYVIDGVGDTVVRRVRMRGAPIRMVFNVQLNKLYVICIDDRVVRVYDGAADTLVAEVPFGELNVPYTVLWHPVSNRVFCATDCDAEIDTVFVIDCVTDEIAERGPTGSGPYAMCWNPANNLVYIGTGCGIVVLSADGHAVLDTVPAYAGDMCFAPCPNKIYSVTSGWTYVINCDSQTLSKSLPYGSYCVVCDTRQGKVYGAARYGTHVFDARADTWFTTISTGQSPERICWNSMNSRIYIADAMDDVVYVIRDTTTGVAEPAVAVVNRSPLIRASPSPFARTVTIECGARLAPGARICIFSQDGRQVKKLVPGLTPPGSPTTSTWDGKDELGRCVPRGVYLAVAEDQCGVRVKLVKLD